MKSIDTIEQSKANIKRLIQSFPQLLADRAQWVKTDECTKTINTIKKQLDLLKKQSPDCIQSICINNSKLPLIAQTFIDQNCSRSITISMFTTMITCQKMVKYINSINVPFFIYFYLITSFNRHQFKEAIVRNKTLESIRFIHEYQKKSLVLPRVFANFLHYLIDGYVYNQLNKIDRVQQLYNIVFETVIDFLNKNINLAASTGILGLVFKKSVEAELEDSRSLKMVECIIGLYSLEANRGIIEEVVQFGKIFCFFMDNDYRMKSEKNIERIAKLVEMALSMWPSLLYLLQDKHILRNFILSLRNKTNKDLQLILSLTFGKILRRILDNDKSYLEKSKNSFIINSNSINFRFLLLLHNLVQEYGILDVVEKIDKKETITRELIRAVLQYFPDQFKWTLNRMGEEKVKEVKQNQMVRQVKSFYKECIFQYQFNLYEFRSYLLLVKEGVKQSTQTVKEITRLLQDIQQNKKLFQDMVIDFFTVVINSFQTILWQTKYLKVCKYISSLLEYEIRKFGYKRIQPIVNQKLIQVFNTQNHVFQYLIITIIDDYGKLFSLDSTIEKLIRKNLSNEKYAYKISRFMVHAIQNISYSISNEVVHDRKETLDNMIENKLQKLIRECLNCGSEELVLQMIQIIKRYIINHDSVKDDSWWMQIIFELLSNSNEEIVTCAIQFFQEVSYYHKIKWTTKQINKSINVNNKNLMRRILYLYLSDEETITKINTASLEEELERWMKTEKSMIELSNHMDKHHQIIKAKDNKIDLQFIGQDKIKLTYLPWTIKINQQHYVAFPEFNTPNKISVRSRINCIIPQKLRICLKVVGEQIIKPLQEKNNVIDLSREDVVRAFFKSKSQKKIRLYRNNTMMLITKHQSAEDFILEKVVIEINFSEQSLKPLGFDINFLPLISKTQFGINFLRDKSFMEFIKQKIQQENDVEFTKGILYSLGFILVSKYLNTTEKYQFLELISKKLTKNNGKVKQTTNLDIRQIMFWLMNIIVKDDECRKKIIQKKNQWIVIKSQSLSGFDWMCLPNQEIYLPQKKRERVFKRYQIIRKIWFFQKNENVCVQVLKKLHTFLNQEDRMLEQSKKQTQRKVEEIRNVIKQLKNIKQLFSNIITYISIINFSTHKTTNLLNAFRDYIQDDRFSFDFPQGFPLL